MGKKTKIRTKPQKYGRKYGSHPYARALAKRAEKSKYIEAVEEAIETKSIKVETEQDDSSKPATLVQEDSAKEAKEAVTPAETEEKAEVVKKPKSRRKSRTPADDLKVELDKPIEKKPSKKSSTTKKKPTTKSRRRSPRPKTKRAPRKKTSEK